MTTLLIASPGLPPVAGGAQQVTWQLARRLAKDFEVHILTAGRVFSVEDADVTLHGVAHLPLLTLFYSTAGFSAIRRIIKDVRPSLIHSHMPLPWGYVLRKENSKKIITCHGSDVFPRKRYPRRFFLKQALSNADAVISPSKWLAAHILKDYGIQSSVIPNGVDTRLFRPLENLEPEPNVVLFAGRFIKLKGVLELLQAARTLPQYEFWFIGGSDAGPSIEIPSLPNVKNLGFQKNVVPFYARARICVFPSHRENFPIAGLEAMSCGKAIVATKLGFSEYIENGVEGVLVSPFDVDELVYSIKSLMENDEMRKTFERNARTKAGQYDWNIVTERYKALYESL